MLDLLPSARRAYLRPVIQCLKIVGLFFSARNACLGPVIQCPKIVAYSVPIGHVKTVFVSFIICISARSCYSRPKCMGGGLVI